MRLIDADALREDFKASKVITFAERMKIACIVDHAPTVDRPHGDIEELKELIGELEEEKNDIDLNKVSEEKLSWNAGFKNGMARAILRLTHFVKEKGGDSDA